MHVANAVPFHGARNKRLAYGHAALWVLDSRSAQLELSDERGEGPIGFRASALPLTHAPEAYCTPAHSIVILYSYNSDTTAMLHYVQATADHL